MNNMGEFLEIAKVMVEPTMKLLEMCSNAVGVVYEPRHMRKMADAEAYRIRQISGAISEADRLPIAYENGDISMSSTNFEDFAQRAEFREKWQLLREQRNIENVVGNAYQELEGIPKVDSEPVDDDWAYRFFDIAKGINAEEMQYIWGKILAGEVSRPGSFSTRTLETIRNMSREEAESFQKMIPCIVTTGRDYFITSEKKIYEKFDIKYTDILRLDECGLMSSSGPLTLTRTVIKESGVLIFNDALVMITSGTPEKPTEVQCGIHTLTRAGRELYQILEHVPNENYFLAVAESIVNENTLEKAMIHKVTEITEDIISYEDEPVRVFGKDSEEMNIETK